MQDELRQADLSGLAVEDMTEEQRAELRRRYESFIRGLAKRVPPARTPNPPRAPAAMRWVPGKKIR